MTADLVWTIGGTLLGAAGLVFGFFESYRATKVRQVLKTITKTYPGDVAKIYQSAYWAWSNVNKALEILGTLTEGERRQELLNLVSNAKADTAATERMLTNLFNQLLASQDAQFKIREVTHPDRKGLVLCKREYESTKDPNNFTC